MPKAVLKDGRIIPLEPLPPEWKDGTEIYLEARPESETERDDTAEWLQGVEEAALAIPPESERTFQEAIRAIRAEAKLEARREVGVAE